MLKKRTRRRVDNGLGLVAILIVGLIRPAGLTAGSAEFDLCGCAKHPDSLGAFDSADPTTWPPGTEISKAQNWRMYIPLPPDGVLIFDSFKAERWKGHGNCEIWFKPNAANTPVTILVAGDFFLKTRVHIVVYGMNATNGHHKVNGRGGVGGPGGFRGGDGAYQDVNGQGAGGEGAAHWWKGSGLDWWPQGRGTACGGRGGR